MRELNSYRSTVRERSALGFGVTGLSTIAFFALFANCNVENVSAAAETDGDMQMMSLSLPLPMRESLRILVSLEFRKGICVLAFSINA